jgi:GDPmannose 4,6-dehydratase
MWLMLQQEEPDDYVIATGEQHNVREFIRAAFNEVGLELEFFGDGAAEVGRIAAVNTAVVDRACDGVADHREAALSPGKVVVRVDPRYFRPVEVETLLGDATKAREKLGWEPAIGFGELVHEMVREDIDLARRTSVLRKEGYAVLEPTE